MRVCAHMTHALQAYCKHYMHAVGERLLTGPSPVRCAMHVLRLQAGAQPAARLCRRPQGAAAGRKGSLLRMPARGAVAMACPWQPAVAWEAAAAAALGPIAARC